MDMQPSKSLFSDPFVKYSLVGVLAILALFLLAKTWSVADDITRPHTDGASITVSGTGKASTPPTIAEISFTVDERAKTESEAQTQATNKTNAALSALKALGIADKDIQTQGYQVSPQYETPNCRPGQACPQSNTVTGYQVTQSITAKVRDTGKAGDVLKALADAGVQNVSGPNFQVDDPSAVQAEARGKAIADAHEKAEVLARQLGVRLGKVVNFSEGGAYPVFQNMMTKSAEAGIGGVAVPSPSVPVGESETNVNVSVTYEIR